MRSSIYYVQTQPHTQLTSQSTPDNTTLLHTSTHIYTPIHIGTVMASVDALLAAVPVVHPTPGAGAVRVGEKTKRKMLSALYEDYRTSWAR